MKILIEKQGYKETELGLLPEDWNVIKLDKICEVKGGKRLPKGESLIEKKTEHPYIRVSDMFMGGISLDNILYVPNTVFASIKNYTISSEDLFISVAGTLGLVGEVPLELNGANLTENADKLTNIKINKRFLLYVLMSDLVQSYVKNVSTSNAQPKLALTRIREFLIPIPKTDEEQQKIAEILSTVDEKIDHIDKQIKQAEQLKKGLMQELLTKGIGHTEFKGSEIGHIPQEWEIKSGSNISLKITKGSSPKWQGFDYQEEGTLFVTSENVRNGTLDISNPKFLPLEFNEKLKNSQLNNGDILINIVGASIGRACQYFSNYSSANINQAVCLLRLKEDIYSNFVLHYLQFTSTVDRLLNTQAGSARQNLSLKDINNFLFVVPPIEEQKEIANVLSTAEEKLEALKNKKSEYENLKKGLMQKLLTGQIRVRV